MIGARPWVGYRAAALLIVTATSSLGCVPKQMIPMDLGPAPLEVYLDGEKLKQVPSELELRANRDHTIFVKREGYRSQLVVLTTVELEGESMLDPGSISLELKPITDTTKALTVELEEVPDP
jgi:hypothetical protein